MNLKVAIMRSVAPVAALCCLTLATLGSGTKEERPFDVRQPSLDKSGWFWVYRDGKTLRDRELELKPVPPYGIPYLPYAWMPEAASRMSKMTLDHRDNPLDQKTDPNQAKMCMAVSVRWEDPYWCGVGFISGPDQGVPGSPWWGKTNDGWYYDLSKLKHKKLILYMRGARGGERVQWKVGFLANEKYGDSLKYPVQTKMLALGTEWSRYEIDLRKSDLSRVCSLCFVVGQSWQDDPDADVQFFIDSVYFE